jgi:hypothetical protein
MELMFRMSALLAIGIATGCGTSTTTTSDIATTDAIKAPPDLPSNVGEAPANDTGDVEPTPTNDAIVTANQPATEPAAPQPENGPPAAEREPNAAPGLAVGKAAPNFTLKDQSGQAQSLESMLMQGPVALVFYRSADW